MHCNTGRTYYQLIQKTHFSTYTRCSENHNNKYTENRKTCGLKFRTLQWRHLAAKRKIEHGCTTTNHHLYILSLQDFSKCLRLKCFGYHRWWRCCAHFGKKMCNSSTSPECWSSLAFNSFMHHWPRVQSSREEILMTEPLVHNTWNCWTQGNFSPC